MRRMMTYLVVLSLCFGTIPLWAHGDSCSDEEVTAESFRDHLFLDLAAWRHTQARERLENDKVAFGKSNGYLVAWAVMLAEERTFEKAIKDLKKATRKDKADPAAPYYLGEILSWQKDETATEAWKQSRDRAVAMLDLNKKNGWAMYWLGSALIRLGEYRQAESKLKKALKNGADRAMTEFQIGSAMMYQEKWESAVAAFSRCLEEDSGFAHAYFMRGRILQELGKTEEMLLDMDRFLTLAPDAREANAAKSILRAGG